MKRILSLALLALCLSGCGGGSSAPTLNPFIGTWIGTFSNTRDPNPETGPATLTIDQGGEVTGTMTFPNQPVPASVSGEVAANGQTTLTAIMPTANGVSNVPFTMTGTLTSTATRITGTLNVVAFSAPQYEQSLNLTKQ